MSKPSMTITDGRWREYGAEEWCDPVVAAMKLGGVDRLFFVSGSELSFYQEAIARARVRGWPAPELTTMVHEGVAINAAVGWSMIAGEPAACVAHADVGTLHYGAGLHTAWRGNYPLLIMAGAGPRALPGSMVGARVANVQWEQEPRDQGGILRQYTKMDHRMEHQDNPGLMVSRLLQVAMSEPKGPVYLIVPQETARLPMPGTTHFPTRDELGIARPAAPDTADARKVARWLIEARNPLVLAGKAGRNPEAVEELVRLAELLSLPVTDTGRASALNFPSNSPLYRSGSSGGEADVILVLEGIVPWTGAKGRPKPETKIVWVDPDSVQSRYKTMEFHADLWFPVCTAAFARAVREVAETMLSASDMSRIQDRLARLKERKAEIEDAEDRKAQAASKRNPIHPLWLAHEIGAVLEPDAILLDDARSNSEILQIYHRRDQAGTYFRSGGSAGGWGSGASLGAKLAAPGRDVVLATGDGYFIFGSPLAALWAAAHHKAATLSVIFVNRSYSTGTNALAAQYPKGVAVTKADFTGGLFDPPPNFAKLAEAANSYGEVVTEPQEIRPALQRGLKQTRAGVPAVIAVMLPTIPEEWTLSGRTGAGG
jgi:acetolactate synthase I/II/III large subunit